MSYRMKSLIEVDPKAAAEEILRAFEKAKCHVGDSAELLGCQRQTFARWVKLLKLDKDLKRLAKRAEKEGWHHGRKGGAGFHRDPEKRIAKYRRTRAKRRKEAETGAAATA